MNKSINSVKICNNSMHQRGKIDKLKIELELLKSVSDS